MLTSAQQWFKDCVKHALKCRQHVPVPVGSFPGHQKACEPLLTPRFASVMVDLDCQLDRTQNRLGDTSLGMSVRDFLDWLSQNEKTHPSLSSTVLWKSRLHRQEKVS